MKPLRLAHLQAFPPETVADRDEEDSQYHQCQQRGQADHPIADEGQDHICHSFLRIAVIEDVVDYGWDVKIISAIPSSELGPRVPL
ncbi:MAG: hypothetical protein M1299_09540 [Firmicutes bacterium]|nr:hypothetical protein [Bacillota bacterium]